MKRSFDASECHQPDKQSRPPRQIPLSCHFCRTKKLKCDRQFPCSNCRARKLKCSSWSEPSLNPSGATNEELSENINDLRARLQRLEDLVSANGQEKVDSKDPSFYVATSETSKGKPGEGTEASKSMNLLEMGAFEHQPLNVNSEGRIDQLFASSFMSIIAPTARLPIDHQTLSLLPSRKQAERLLDYFADQVSVFYHFIHTATVRNILDIVYTHLENNRRPRNDYLALLSTIFALSAYFGSSSSRFQFKGTADAKTLCYRWILVAQQALCAADYLIYPTLETLQSVMLIAAYLVPNMDSMSIFRMLMASALQGALQLSLNQIDSPANKEERENENVDWVEIESKRRIWWHLASTDWILSSMSGPRCGTYMIHPKQMTVELPTNVNDEDINSSGNYAQPLGTVPTDMTFYILRTKISIMFREFVDAATDSGCIQEELPYELVIEFDKKLNGIMKGAPVCFRIDPKTRGQQQSDIRLYCLIGSSLNRLHRPYLARGASDPKYSYSRMVCLRTARSIVELCKEMTAPNEEFQHFKMWTIVHPLFSSVLVLVMDYCLNRKEPRAEERKAEILEAFGLLETYQEESTLAKRGLQQIRQFLKGSHSDPIQDSTDLEDSHTKQGYIGALVASSNLQQHGGSGSSSTNIPFQTTQYTEPFSEYDWTDSDFPPLESTSFDVDLDENQFEVLLRKFEGSHPMY